MQLATTGSYLFTWVRVLSSHTKDDMSWRGHGEEGPSHTVGGKIVENSMEVPQKIKNRPSTRSSKPSIQHCKGKEISPLHPMLIAAKKWKQPCVHELMNG
jgi:hypothetical protein